MKLIGEMIIPRKKLKILRSAEPKTKEYMRIYYKKNKGKILERIKQNCDNKKEYDRERYIKNKEMNLEMCKKYRDTHREEMKKYQKKYYIKNKEMLLKKGSLFRKTEEGKATDQRSKIKRNTALKNIINTLTAEEWIEILKEYKFKCAYCGREFNLFDRPTRDHVIPLSKGGDNTKENIVPACKSCNSKKHDKLLILERKRRDAIKVD